MFTVFQVDKLIETITRKNPKTQNYICRDELSKNNKPRKLQRSPKIIGYERECSELYSELNQPLLPSSHHEKKVNNNKTIIKNYDNNNNTNVRVKILMRKEDAAKLLSKCNEKGSLELTDVVSELVKLPSQQINVVSITNHSKEMPITNQSKKMQLATIFEEDEMQEKKFN